MDVTNVEAQLAPSVVYLNAKFQSPAGQSASATDPWKLLPNIFVSMPM